MKPEEIQALLAARPAPFEPDPKVYQRKGEFLRRCRGCNEGYGPFKAPERAALSRGMCDECRARWIAGVPVRPRTTFDA